MRNLFRITSALLIVMLLTLCSKSNTENNYLEVRHKIENMNAEFETAYKSGDAEKVASLATEDAIISPIDLPDIKGREAIKSLLSNFFQSSTVISYDLNVEEFERYKDTIYDRGTYIWISQQEGKSEVKVLGRYSAVRKKGAENKWLFHRIIENALP